MLCWRDCVGNGSPQQVHSAQRLGDGTQMGVLPCHLDCAGRRFSKDIDRFLSNATRSKSQLEEIPLGMCRYVFQMPIICNNCSFSCSVFLVCFGITCFCTLVFSCVPIAAHWDLALAAKPGTKCFSGQTYSRIGLFNSIINIITDVLFAVLPIPIIVKLQVNKRTKIVLAFILSLGWVACAAGIVKARLQLTFITTPDSNWDDSFNVWVRILFYCFWTSDTC